MQLVVSRGPSSVGSVPSNACFPELGVERSEERPFIRMTGRAREGTDSPALLWNEFISVFEAELPEAKLKPRWGEAEFRLDMTSLARIVPEEDTGESDPEDDDGFTGDEEGL